MMKKTGHWGHNEPNQDLAAVSVEQETRSICRGCLSTEHRMFNAMTFADSFKDLTGITISPTDGLPQWLCYVCTALLHECVKFRNKIMKSHYRLSQYVLESVPLEEQIDDTDEHDTDMLSETAENVQVKDERVFSDHEDNIDEEEHREVTPPRQSESDAASISNAVKKEEEDKTKKCTEMSNYEGIKRTEAARVESRVVTQTVRHSLRARLRFDDDICSDIEEPTTHNNDLKETAANKIQEIDEERHESCKYNKILTKCEQVDDSDEYVNSSTRSNVQLYDKEKQHPADNTSTRHSDDAEEEVKHNIHRDDSVSSLHSNVTFNSGYVSDKSKHSNVTFNSGDVSDKRSERDTSLTTVHTGGKPYRCDVCMKCFTKKVYLKQHVRIHGDRPYECNICTKRFVRKSALESHISIHDRARERLYKCDICMKGFLQRKYLKEHMLVHSGSKPYKCDICALSFCQKSNLVRHVRVHTGEKPYKCDFCMKCFGTKQHLMYHIFLHTGERPYKCDICMKAFTQSQTLKTHILVHTGSKPYKCDICTLSFSRKGSLVHHVRMHTGEKPYKCDICTQGFTRKDYLECHARIHTGEKPYKCDVCMKRFSQTGYLRKHMRVHPGNN